MIAMPASHNFQEEKDSLYEQEAENFCNLWQHTAAASPGFNLLCICYRGFSAVQAAGDSVTHAAIDRTTH